MLKRIAYQGVSGSFSSMAARALFGTAIESLHTKRFRDIFQHLEAGSADFGVVPLENALAGTVQENYDLLAEYTITIVGEYFCPVQLHLLGVARPDGTVPILSEINQALSHPKALEQCSQFLEQHPQIEQVVHSDTAGAAELVSQRRDPNVAAIASEEAASNFGLHVIAGSIQNHLANSTRFVALAKSSSTPSPADPNQGTKCSLIVTLPHQPGSLHRLLGLIASRGCNVTKIESRPIVGKPFEYRFYLDIEGVPHHNEEIPLVIADLRTLAAGLRVLGVYPPALRPMA